MDTMWNYDELNSNPFYGRDYSLDDITAYAQNPHDDRFVNMDCDKHLELAACADQYLNGDRDLESIYRDAENEMDNCLGNYVYDVLINDYIEVCNEMIEEKLS